jgi:hypothetical protein
MEHGRWAIARWYDRSRLATPETADPPIRSESPGKRREFATNQIGYFAHTFSLDRQLWT